MKKFISLALLFLTISSNGYCDLFHSPLNIEESDGSPSIFPYKLKVTNGALTDNADGTGTLSFVSALSKSGSTALTGAVTISEGANITLTQSGNNITIAASGGSASAGGADTQIQYSDGGVLNGDTGMTFTKASKLVTFTSTTEQLRVRYDATNYYSTTVSSAGVPTFDTTGTKFIFAEPISTTGGQTRSEVFGSGVTVTGSDSVIIGNAATGVANSVIIGSGASGTNNANIVIGRNSSAAGSAVAIGDSVSAGFTFAVSIGLGSSVTAQSGIAIGHNATAPNAVAVGDSAIATTTSIAIGRFSDTTGATQSTALGDSTVVAFGSSIGLGYQATPTAANQCIIGSANAPQKTFYLGSGVTTSGPFNLVVSATGGSGADNVGASFTIAAGKSTGSAAPGSIIFQTSAYGSTGSTLQTLATRVSINTPSGNSGTDNFLYVTGTMPTTLSTSTRGVNIEITGAGSSNIENDAFRIAYAAGYTGPSFCIGLNISNNNAGTGTSLVGAVANYGGYLQATGTTTGYNFGFYGDAGNGNFNAALYGNATRTKNSATNIAVMGVAANAGTSPVVVGGWLTLNSSPTAPSTSAGLIVNNGSLAVDIARFEDNGTAKLIIADGGLIGTYNGIATVSGGVPSELATIDSTGLTANVGASTLYAVPASGEGLYRVSAYVVETTAGSLSSTLPNVQIIFTDKDSNTSITIDATPVLGVAGIGQTGALTSNTVGTASSGAIVIYVKASTTIQYQSVNYASNLAGMTYAIRLKLEAL